MVSSLQNFRRDALSRLHRKRAVKARFGEFFKIRTWQRQLFDRTVIDGTNKPVGAREI